MERGNITIIDDRVTITLVDGTVWLTKYEIAHLFGCFVSKVTGNISTILKAGLFDDRKVYRFHRQDERHFIELYNLEMIIALAFRIHSHNAYLLRQWLMNRAVRLPKCRQVPVLVTWNAKTSIN